MLQHWPLITLILCGFAGPAFTGPVEAAQQVRGIIERLLGVNSALFEVTVDPALSVDGKDTFTLDSNEPQSRITVVGSTGVAAAWGVHHYLTHYCHCHVSWDGDQLDLDPENMPVVHAKVKSLDRYKYYQNVCTTSYSFVWWDWPRWEREIDWMALHGVNLALAFGAQEAIWRRVFDGFGIIDDDFSGPAFLSWGRMGNLRGFGGGLSQAWHARSVSLQHKILQRMRTLGIKTVLPAFNGILPPSFAKTFPTVNGTSISDWNGFPANYCCPFLLSPNDPMFPVVSRVFLREYIAEFGTDHIYNSDTFNENDPDSNEPEYLAATALAIYQGMVEVDPEATWMLQAWMFLNPFWGANQVKAYVTSVPVGKMLILDLQSDLTPLYQFHESYYGQPFIWCTLHNFGGQLGMYGHLENVNKGIVNARTFPNTTMVGIGITPEGIDQNYVMYDFTLNGTLHDTEKNLTDWIVGYARRRYGFENEEVESAWQTLRSTVYDYKLERVTTRFRKPRGNHIAQNILTKLPTLSLTEISWYQKNEFFNAFVKLVNAASSTPSLKESALFSHDLVDTARQVVQLTTGLLYQKMVVHFRNGDVDSFRNTSHMIPTILDALDQLLLTNKKFLLGPWLESAKAAAQSQNESSQFEWNARNQITLWGPSGEIRDYAAKQWSGMISDFYKPRWQVFIGALNEELNGGAKYNRTLVTEEILQTVELPFTRSQSIYPVVPAADPVGTVIWFNQTWGVELEKVFDPNYIPQPRSVVGYQSFSKHGKHLR